MSESQKNDLRKLTAKSIEFKIDFATEAKLAFTPETLLLESNQNLMENIFYCYEKTGINEKFKYDQAVNCLKKLESMHQFQF